MSTPVAIERGSNVSSEIINQDMSIMDEEVGQAATTLQVRMEELVAGYKELNRLSTMAPMGVQKYHAPTSKYFQDDYIETYKSIENVSLDKLLEKNHSILYELQIQKKMLDRKVMDLSFKEGGNSGGVDKTKTVSREVQRRISKVASQPSAYANPPAHVKLPTRAKVKPSSSKNSRLKKVSALEQIYSQPAPKVVVVKRSGLTPSLEKRQPATAKRLVQAKEKVITKRAPSETLKLSITPSKASASTQVTPKSEPLKSQFTFQEKHKTQKKTVAVATQNEPPPSSIGTQVASEHRTMPSVSMGPNDTSYPNRPEALRRLFCDLDSDKDGRVSLAELRMAMHRMGVPCSRQSTQKFFDSCCGELSNQVISFKQFAAYLSAAFEAYHNPVKTKKILVSSKKSSPACEIEACVNTPVSPTRVEKDVVVPELEEQNRSISEEKETLQELSISDVVQEEGSATNGSGDELAIEDLLDTVFSPIGESVAVTFDSQQVEELDEEKAPKVVEKAPTSTDYVAASTLFGRFLQQGPRWTPVARTDKVEQYESVANENYAHSEVLKKVFEARKLRRKSYLTSSADKVKAVRGSYKSHSVKEDLGRVAEPIKIEGRIKKAIPMTNNQLLTVFPPISDDEFESLSEGRSPAGDNFHENSPSPSETVLSPSNDVSLSEGEIDFESLSVISDGEIIGA